MRYDRILSVLLIILLTGALCLTSCGGTQKKPPAESPADTPAEESTPSETPGETEKNEDNDDSESPDEPSPPTSTGAALYGTFTATSALPRLKAVGTTLVDENEQVVQLIGVNLGGWLVFEEWFCPIYDNSDAEPKAAGSDIYQTLIDRFGEEKADTLLKTYQQNWITTYDLDYLSSLGINCVRVPFWYRNLQTADGSWRLNEKGEIDFDRLDWIVEECGKRGMYVILDLHGAPGYQNAAHHSGANYSMHLFDNTSAGETYRLQTEELWRAVATHFKGCGTVAAYDLLNEPYCDVSSINYTNINNMYDRLYKTVREADPNTINIMEGIWRLNNLPNPGSMGWSNVMYEVHFYDYTASAVTSNCTHLTTYAEQYNIPVYVGEFESGDHEVQAIEGYAATGASLTTWTYKGNSTATQWFLRYATDRGDANIVKDSYDTILKRWGEQCRTDYSYNGFLGIGSMKAYAFNTTIIQALCDAISAAPQNKSTD